VQALTASEHGRERLHGRADDVDLGLLRGQGDARGLCVEAHQQGALLAAPKRSRTSTRPDAPQYRAVLATSRASRCATASAPARSAPC